MFSYSSRGAAVYPLVVTSLAIGSFTGGCAEPRQYANSDASVANTGTNTTTNPVNNTVGDRTSSASRDQSVPTGDIPSDTNDNGITVTLDSDAALAPELFDAGSADATDESEVSSDATSNPECESHGDCDDGNECNGAETCEDNRCRSAEVEADGTICAGAGDADFVCRDGNCLTSRCGDGIIDGRSEEVCDDGNVTNGDGCNVDCNYSCTTSAQCDDGNVCNGSESCNVDAHVCAAGDKAEDGTECGTERACMDGRCLSTACGDGEVTEGEECDDENLVEGDGCTADCQFDCEADEDCDDQDICTGIETCNLDTHRCETGETLVCDDANPCTEDTCAPAGGCSFALIDEDDDGQAPITKGSDCGTDCDDGNDQVFAGAGELCDGLDNNCDGTKDELATVWYPDCDGDGYAALNSASVQQCDRPAAPSSCPKGSRGTWTIRPPTSELDSDCWDADPDVYPRSDSVWSTTEIEGRRDYPYDYNCRNGDEPRYTKVNVSTRANCSPLVLEPAAALSDGLELPLLQLVGVDSQVGLQVLCTGPSGWEAADAPACGKPGTYSYCDGCTRVVDVKFLQQCQ